MIAVLLLENIYFRANSNQRVGNMLKSEKQIEDVFLPMGKMCIDNYYKAFSREDILKFIDDVVIGEVDPLKDKREKFSREVLKFNYPHSAEFVVDYLKRQLVD